MQYNKYTYEQVKKQFSISNKLSISFSDGNEFLNIKDYFDDTKKVDIVYTWVNGSDPEWIKNYQYFKRKENITIQSNAYAIRFVEGEELRYSLRSVEKYAIHFIRYIYIIVANIETQVPCWLNISHPKIKIITHRMIFGDIIPSEAKNNSNLTFNFNSYSIESCILNIPNLAHKLIYFNDDFFLGKKVEINDFFNRFDKPKIYVNNRDYQNVENEYSSLKTQAENDFAGAKYHAGVSFTVSTFKQKYGNATNLEHLHVAYPTTKNILLKTRENFNDSITNTILSPFRRVNDILMQHITFQYGIKHDMIQPIPNNDTEIAFLYGDVLSDISKFTKIYENKIKLFCINIDIPYQTSKTKAFLNIMFPNKSSFELENVCMPHIEKDDVEYWQSNLNITSFER